MYLSKMLRISNIFFLSICIFLFSCSSKFSFQKRRYNKGFHIAYSKTQTSSKTGKTENKTLTLKSFFNENKVETQQIDTLEVKPEKLPQLTYSETHSTAHNLYVSKNFTNVVRSLTPIVKELENLKNQNALRNSSESVLDSIKIGIAVILTIVNVLLFLLTLAWTLSIVNSFPKKTLEGEGILMIVFVVAIYAYTIIEIWRWASS